MNLKFRLALLYSLSVFIILVSSALTIYFLAENFRKKEFIKQLVIEASEAYQFFARANEPATDTTQYINENTINLISGASTFIYNGNLKLLYASDPKKVAVIPSQYFSKAQKRAPFFFYLGNKESVILVRNVSEKTYYIVASGTDAIGKRKNDNLKILLICSVIGGIILSGFLAFFYVKHAMRPLEELKVEIEQVNEENLKHRINSPTGNDEIRQIAKKFNAMLDRLEQAFEQRKNFVQHASHELRTPLANMLSQTEAALSKELTANQYRSILTSLKEDQQDMIDLTNSLLILSKYEKLSQLSDTTPLRIDELIYQTVDYINQSFPTTVVSIDFESIPENEDLLLFTGNETLLKAALKMLIKNAAMFAEDLRVKISIDPGEKYITLRFENTGKQLNPDEQNRLFIPFFRGENAQTKKGHGLGLSIVERIVNVHKGKISYKALPDNINQFTVTLPIANN